MSSSKNISNMYKHCKLKIETKFNKKETNAQLFDIKGTCSLGHQNNS